MSHAPGAAGRLRDAIRRDGAVVVSGVAVDRDDELIALVSALGTPTALGNGSGVIHEVTPRPDAGADLSSSAASFPLHTDSTFLLDPHDVVALACLEAAERSGGESRVVGIGALRERIADPDVLGALAEPAFPFLVRDPGCAPGVRKLAILADRGGGDCTVRYRSDAVAMAMRDAGVELSARHRMALLSLEEALADETLQAAFVLRPGEVLLLDNRRTLHGRTAIAGGARRVLRRLKAFAR